MNVTAQTSRITQLQQHRLILAVALLALGISDLLLAASVLMKNRAIVIVPAHIDKEFEISAKGISQEYLELMARDFIQSVLNITPESREYVERYILRLASPKYHGELKQQLGELLEEIRDRQISLHFALSELEVNQRLLAVEASGYLSKYMGTQAIEKKSRKYRLVFSNNGTRLWLEEFYEVESDAKESGS